MSAAPFIPEFGMPSRLTQGIWRAIRPTTEVDRQREARRFREANKADALAVIARLPDSIHAHVAEGWDARYGIPVDEKNGSPVARANEFAREACRDFGAARAGRAYDEAEIRDYAESYASCCARMHTLEKRIDFAASFGIEPPAGARVTPEGIRERLDDPLWWRRQLRKVWTRHCENAMRRTGIIRKGKAPYASDEAVRHRRGRKRATREWMGTRVMVNGEGEQLELLKLHDKSLANPALRRGEFMCRMRGFEELATDAGHVALFFTLTAPGTFHAQLSRGGLNPNHQRQTVRDAQEWLRKRWSLARSKLARLSIQYFGFRVAEPHHDATPHWHMVLFVSPENQRLLRRVIRDMWVRDKEHRAEIRSRAAFNARYNCRFIRAGKGSATGYVAKYVSKNIDAAGAIGEEISDETGERVESGVERVGAWASIHGIRQFQQFGGPPVGLWRECRRVRVANSIESIESVRSAADRGNWKEFVQALGGSERARRRVRSSREKFSRHVTPPMIRVRRLSTRQWSNKHGPRVAWDRRPATPAEMPAAWLDKMHPRRADPQGREVLAETRYHEPTGERAAGVVAVGLLGRWASIDTRAHRWKIQRATNTHSHSGVMNPPRPAALGREAGNPIALNAAGDFWVQTGPAGVAPGAELEGARPALSDSSFFRSGSGLFSTLGPVAISVRTSNFIPNPALAWIATVPYRPPKRDGPS
jgi:hypothetical protein